MKGIDLFSFYMKENLPNNPIATEEYKFALEVVKLERNTYWNVFFCFEVIIF